MPRFPEARSRDASPNWLDPRKGSKNGIYTKLLIDARPCSFYQRSCTMRRLQTFLIMSFLLLFSNHEVTRAPQLAAAGR